MKTPILEVTDLAVAFDTEEGDVRAVDSVSFRLEKGGTLGIVGESGCGKSVTALSIMRLLPKPAARIVNGVAMFNGDDIFSLAPEALFRFRGRKISMIFQEPMTALNPVHSIGRQLVEVYDLHFDDMTSADKNDAALGMLDKVGIADAQTVLDKYPHQLSGGMRQRVMIAMALAAQPEVLIADEPTTALDVTVQAQILELIKSLQAQIGMSVILITHDLGVIAQNCDDAVVMYAGRVAERAPIRKLFRSPSHPYTQGLLSSMPSRAKTPKTMLPTIKGQVPSLLSMPEGCRFAARCPKAQQVCLQDIPNEVQMSEDHFSACWFSGGIPV